MGVETQASSRPGIRLHCGSGSEDLEQRLVALLEQEFERQQPVRPMRVVRLLVPSAWLRADLAARLALRCPRAALGLSIETLWSHALTILHGAGVEVRCSEAAADLLAQRSILEQEHLRTLLGRFDAGADAAAAALSDLLSAGFQAADLGQLCQLLEPQDLTGRTLLSAAASWQNRLREHGLTRTQAVYGQAARELARQPPRTERAQAYLVVGFAGVTGETAALLAGLGRLAPLHLVLDLPGLSRTRIPGAERHPLRMLPLLGVPAPSELPQREARCCELVSLCGSGQSDTFEEVALRVRLLLEQGTQPERVAIVARRLEPVALALRRALEHHAVPFSGGLLPSGVSAGERPLAALLELLCDGPEASIHAWIDARGEPENLRLALATLGSRQLGQFAQLPLEELLEGRTALRLPSRAAALGIEEGVDDEEQAPDSEQETQAAERAAADSPVRLARRELAAHELFTARERVRSWLQTLEQRAPMRTLEQRFEELLRALQAADFAPQRAAAWLQLLRAQTQDWPAALELSLEEGQKLFARALLESPDRRLGGLGSGVQLLTPEAARCGNFEHLFLVDLQQGTFPRIPREDPLLTDAARARLAHALPALWGSAQAEDEELFLFASLLECAAKATLVWCVSDDEGRALAPSALVQQLLGSQQIRDTPRLPRARLLRLSAPWRQTPGRTLEATECLHWFGLQGASRSALAALLRAGAPDGRPAAEELARAAAAALESLEPHSALARGSLGAHQGQVLAHSLPLSEGHLSITLLERIAVCPWKTFLERALFLEPTPEPQRCLPDLDPRLIGICVHGALELLYQDPSAPTERLQLKELLAQAPRRVLRPDATRCARALELAARAAVREALIAWPGMLAALQLAARPLLERALELDFEGQADLEHLGSEVEQSLVLDDAGRRLALRFRADRAGLRAGQVELVDYKTGTALSTAKQATTRRAHLLRHVHSGTHLQVALYARAAEHARGVYLYLDPALDEECARVPIVGTDVELQASLLQTASALEQAWSRGVLPPRLEDTGGKEPVACKRCDLRLACSRGDSGARRRLAALAKDAAPAELEPTVAQRLRLLQTLWLLGPQAETSAQPTAALSEDAGTGRPKEQA